MFLCKIQPVSDLPGTPHGFDLRPKFQRLGVRRLQLQSVLYFLKGKRIFFLVKKPAGTFQELPHVPISQCLIDLPPQFTHRRMQITFFFQLPENLVSNFVLRSFQRPFDSSQPEL